MDWRRVLRSWRLNLRKRAAGDGHAGRRGGRSGDEEPHGRLVYGSGELGSEAAGRSGTGGTGEAGMGASMESEAGAAAAAAGETEMSAADMGQAEGDEGASGAAGTGGTGVDAAEAVKAARQLVRDIREAHRDWVNALRHFEHALGPDQIDYAIFAIEAAEKRYEMLLRQAKRLNVHWRTIWEQGADAG